MSLLPAPAIAHAPPVDRRPPRRWTSPFRRGRRLGSGPAISSLLLHLWYMGNRSFGTDAYLGRVSPRPLCRSLVVCFPAGIESQSWTAASTGARTHVDTVLTCRSGTELRCCRPTDRLNTSPGAAFSSTICERGSPSSARTTGDVRGLASVNSDPMDSRTLEMVKAGLQLSFKMSKQICPLLFTLQ
eukprot:scaffold4698_cov332-Prasinococcus_capsulatus_cf.AAC.3